MMVFTKKSYLDVLRICSTAGAYRVVGAEKKMAEHLLAFAGVRKTHEKKGANKKGPHVPPLKTIGLGPTL